MIELHQQLEFLSQLDLQEAGNQTQIVQILGEDIDTSSRAGFRDLFQNSTDVYFFRIVDQMATMNLRSYLEISKDSLDAVKPKVHLSPYEQQILQNFEVHRENRILRQQISTPQNMMIYSSNASDIVTTIQMLNQSYVNSHRNFADLFKTVINRPIKGKRHAIQYFVEFMQNFVSAQMINDNFYAFSFNQSLLEMPLSQLQTIPGVRMKYLQVDILNKCVPQDWFLGYDQFSVYTFLNLQRLMGQSAPD